jgi:glycosyltransferase involved in cell wall biosynthesis
MDSKIMSKADPQAKIDVSFVMPCLNEALSLEVCINAALEAAATLHARHGLVGEVIVADNGSTDGSQAIAMRLGARVVQVEAKGYGAALMGGFAGARGQYLVMADADGSYNFREAVGMVERLMAGADLCMGSRFLGGIAPGAMPWKNRYIGNPILTGILNVLFGTRIGDAHCGLRALTRDLYQRLRLSGPGMEFASEMVIKASLLGARIAEAPATLSPDLRDRPPHLRPWRDGWRHLRYLLMLSPLWLYAIPATVAGLVGVSILGSAGWALAMHPGEEFYFGNYWVILAGALVSASHLSLFLGLATQVYGVKEGYRRPSPILVRLARWLTLESMIGAGIGLILIGLTVLAMVFFSWGVRGFAAFPNVLPPVVGTLCLTLGSQTLMAGFLMAILGGNQARFLEVAEKAAEEGADRLGSARAA